MTGPDQDDAARVAGLRAGDAAVVTGLVADFTPAMLRLARAHTGSAASAEDVVQDAWLTVLTSIDRFEGRSALRTWVLGIVVNKARRAADRERRLVPLTPAWRDDRQERRAPAVDPDRFAAPGGSQAPGTWVSPPHRWDALPEEELGLAELRAVFDAALTALPGRQRAVLTARDVLHLGADEVSALYGLSEGNQRVLLHRARSRVRAAVEHYLAAATTDAGPAPAGTPATTRSAVTTSAGRRQPVGGLAPGSGAAPRRPRPGQAVVCQQLVELVDDYLDGSLEPSLRRRVEEHLAGCDGCDGYVAQVRRMLDVTGSLVEPAPAPLVGRLAALLRDSRR